MHRSETAKIVGQGFISESIKQVFTRAEDQERKGNEDGVRDETEVQMEPR